MASRYCRVCGDFHNLDKDWPQACYGHFRAKSSSALQIIKDIEPYKAVAADKATGKTPVIGGRRQHREFLKRNGYHEVGNEQMRQRPIDYGDIHPREIKETIDRLRSERG